MTEKAEDIYLCMVIYLAYIAGTAVAMTSQQVRLKLSELKALKDTYDSRVQVITLKVIKPKKRTEANDD